MASVEAAKRFSKQSIAAWAPNCLRKLSVILADELFIIEGVAVEEAGMGSFTAMRSLQRSGGSSAVNGEVPEAECALRQDWELIQKMMPVLPCAL